MSKLLNTKAAEAMADKGEYSSAAELLLKWAESDARLANELMEEGARHAVMRVASDDRRDGLHRPIVSKGDDTDGLRAVANRTLLDTYRLVGGQPLGDASKGDLIASAQRHESLAVGNIRAAKFERLVAKAMGRATKVREAVTDNKLRELQSLAEKQANPYGKVSDAA